MITGKSKAHKKYLKHLGLSTLVIGTVIGGYALTSQASDNADSNVSIVDSVEQVNLDQVPFLEHGGRGEPGDFGRPGGHDHGGEQTLSDNAFDPNNLVTIDPTVVPDTTATTGTVPDTTATTGTVPDNTATTGTVPDNTATTTTVPDNTATTDDTATTDAEATVTDTPATSSEDQVYYDGQYAGDAVRADRWGNMQVVVVVEDGELTDVLIANYPRSTSRSDIISRNAMPTLISEAIAAQDSNIDVVSGATDTSVAFIQSLDSALEDAIIIDSAGSAN